MLINSGLRNDDFETTTELKGSPLAEGNRLVLASYYSSHTGRITSTFGSEYDMGHLVEACERAAFIVCHNTKFELGWLKRCGLDLRKVITFMGVLDR
jgi:hypothetical protein